MKTRKRLLRVSLLMLVIAVIFVFCALSNPALGRTIYILVMAGLFLTSFFVKNREG